MGLISTVIVWGIVAYLFYRIYLMIMRENDMAVDKKISDHHNLLKDQEIKINIENP